MLGMGYPKALQCMTTFELVDADVSCGSFVQLGFTSGAKWDIG